MCVLQVLSNQQLFQQHKNELSENEDRVNALNQHLRNVRQELLLTQVQRSMLLSLVCVNLSATAATRNQTVDSPYHLVDAQSKCLLCVCCVEQVQSVKDAHLTKSL